MFPAPLCVVTEMGGPHARRSRPPSAAPMWRGTALATSEDGREEAYSIGLDGYIWSYGVNSDSGRTGRLISTGLRATTFAIGTLHNGHTLVIAADGALVHYVVETGKPGQRWSLACPVTFAAPLMRTVSVDKIFTQTLGHSLFVGVLTRHRGIDDEDGCQFWESIWTREGLVFRQSHLQIERERNIWRDKVANSLYDSA